MHVGSEHDLTIDKNVAQKLYNDLGIRVEVAQWYESEIVKMIRLP